MRLYFDFSKWWPFVMIIIFGVIVTFLVPNHSFWSWLSDIIFLCIVVALIIIMRQNKPGFIFNESGVYVLKLPYLTKSYVHLEWSDMSTFEFCVESTENGETIWLYIFKKWKSETVRVEIGIWDQDHALIEREFRSMASKMNVFEFRKDKE